MKKILLLLLLSAQKTLAVKIGIELELQGIQYVIPASVGRVDHIRLFESAPNGEGADSCSSRSSSSFVSGSFSNLPDWYLEVDGSGNLEFVSRPVDIFQEGERLELCLSQACSLLQHILQKSKWVFGSAGDPGYFLFQAQNGDAVTGISGAFVHKKPVQKDLFEDISAPFHIQILDARCWVRPQATFEIPLEMVGNFASYMAVNHPRLPSAIQSIQRFFPDQKAHKIEKMTQGQGLAYLVILTSELLSTSKKPPKEAGPKGNLSLMSRLSFSGMYACLDVGEQSVYQGIIQQYEKDGNTQRPLFPFLYPLFYAEGGKNIVIAGTDIFKKIQSVKIIDFLRSIQNPREKSDFSDAVSLLEKICNWSGDEWKKSYDFQGADLLSPPPFLDATYSLGKVRNGLKKGVAVIEMRGYAALYTDNMKMGPMAQLWLRREIGNTKASWNPENLTPITAYQEEYTRVDQAYKALQIEGREQAGADLTKWVEDCAKVKERMQIFGAGTFLSAEPFTTFETAYRSFNMLFFTSVIPSTDQALNEKKRTFSLGQLNRPKDQ